MSQSLRHVQCAVVRWTLALLVLAALAGCQGGTSTSPPPDAPAPPGDLGISRILVLPFKDLYGVYGENVSFRCPLCGSVNEIGEVAPEAVEVMTQLLLTRMQAREGFEVIPPSQAHGSLSGLVLKADGATDEATLILDAGKDLRADAVLLGRIYRYRQRQGSDFTADVPASVSFDLLLLRVADGRLVWSGHFDETQRTLFENLFRLDTFLKRGGKWISASAMAQEGLDKILTTFPIP